MHAAFYQGFDDFQSGLAQDENPKCPGSPAFWAWRDGWFSAERGERRPPEPLSDTKEFDPND